MMRVLFQPAQQDTAYLTAFSALAGSVVGGVTTASSRGQACAPRRARADSRPNWFGAKISFEISLSQHQMLTVTSW